MFKTVAQLQGLRCLKIPEMGRWIGPGTFRPIAGWSDFVLIKPNSMAAFVDTKTIAGGRFPYSQINTKQIEFFDSLGDVCPAGYVVYFRADVQLVIYYHWKILNQLQPNDSLGPQDGLMLGQLNSFDLRKIFIADSR